LDDEFVLMTKPLQFHFRRKTYLIKPKWGFSLLCLFLFGLCITLGVWQLHRYEYKKILLTTWQKRLNDVPKPFEEIIKKNNLAFQAVKVKGNYMNINTVLIENHFYHGQPGYEILTPLKISNDEKWIWIDRGWIVKPQTGTIPFIPPVDGEQEITGHIKIQDEYQFILGKNIYNPDNLPLIVQRIDINEFSQVMHQSFYPFVLRLNANEPNGYIRDWTIVTVTPARHVMYAIQWFAFALILLIGYFCFCCEEKNKHAKK
jgi:surfeit locus 1 family protein